MRKLDHILIQTWKGCQLDIFLWLPGNVWIKHALFFLLCAAAGLLFIPCLIPCSIRLIKHVIQEMHLPVMPSETYEQAIHLIIIEAV